MAPRVEVDPAHRLGDEARESATARLNQAYLVPGARFRRSSCSARAGFHPGRSTTGRGPSEIGESPWYRLASTTACPTRCCRSRIADVCVSSIRIVIGTPGVLGM